MFLNRFGLIALLCLTTIGCATMPYSQPYGYGGAYPVGIYGSQPYVPPGSTLPQGSGNIPVPITGASIAPAWGLSPAAPTVGTPGASGAPLYNANPNSSTTPGGMQPVPNYQTPSINPTSGSHESNPFPYPEANRGGIPTSSLHTPPAPSKEIELAGGQENYLRPVPAETTEPKYIVNQPVKPSNTSPFPVIEEATPTNNNSPNNGQVESLLAYDADSYRWLRGVVNYDLQSKTWNIIYTATPHKSDAYAGKFTLQNDQRLGILKNKDVVLIEGAVDSEVRDNLGKPTYRIRTISRVDQSKK